MGISWTSSSGSSLNFTTLDGESGSTSQTSAYSSTMGVSSSGNDETEAGTAMAVSGEAFAVGEETIATGDIDLEVVDMGTTTIASGSSTFQASAQSDKGDSAYASADTTLAASSGGKTIAWDIDYSGTVQTEDESSWTAVSSTGATVIYDNEPESESVSTKSGSLSGTATQDDGGPEATGDPESAAYELADDQFTLDFDSGNIATLDIDAAAYGQDTYIDVEASILTIEDQLSTVSGYVMGVVG